MTYATRQADVDPATGLHRAMKLGTLIEELLLVRERLGPDVDVVTVDGTGDTRSMWAAFAGTGYCELFLTGEAS